MTLSEQLSRDFSKGRKVITSCETMPQLESAKRFVKLLMQKYRDIDRQYNLSSNVNALLTIKELHILTTHK